MAADVDALGGGHEIHVKLPGLGSGTVKIPAGHALVTIADLKTATEEKTGIAFSAFGLRHDQVEMKLAAPIGSSTRFTMRMRAIHTSVSQAKRRIEKGGGPSKRHKELNDSLVSIDGRVASVQTSVYALPKTIGAQVTRAMAGDWGDVAVDDIPVDGLVAARNEMQAGKTVRQGRSNLIQQRIDSNKFQRRMQLIQSPEERAQAEIANAAASAGKKTAADNKAAKKEAAEQKKTEKALSAEAKAIRVAAEAAAKQKEKDDEKARKAALKPAKVRL